MPHFSGPLIAEKSKEDHWVIHEEFQYFSDILPTRVVNIPVGFETDLASVPRGLWNLIPKDGQWDQAAVVHDYLYGTGICDRKQADAVFLEAMGILKVPSITRYVMWSAVRIFGGLFWKACRLVKR